MKKIKMGWLIAFLGIFSLVTYGVQILIFKTIEQTFFYFLQDAAFFVLEIIFIYFIVERVLEEREKREKIKKLDVVISSYFIESGTNILRSLSKFDVNLDETKAMLNIDNTWTDETFKSIISTLKKREYGIDFSLYDPELIKTILKDEKNNMLIMLQNPTLLEHDYFTDMLWAIFHLLDELASRDSLSDLPEIDIKHLENDIKRAYRAMLIEWVYYAKHLKHTYPYLFSLAERKKPFDADYSVVISE